MTTQQAFFADAVAAHGDSASDAVRDELIGVVERAWAQHPRSLQTAIGPSEIGVPCARQIAAKLAGAPRVNPAGDLLPAFIGTATHAKLERAFEADNARLVVAGQQPRWLIEQRVEVAPGLSGSCDLYDSHNGGMVIDHKIVGDYAFKKYTKNGPSDQYRTQAHAYGLGFTRAGYPVASVGIWFIPKSSYLHKSYLWVEDFDPSIAESAVARLGLIRTAVTGIGAAEDHSQLDRVPANPADYCRFCQFAGQPSSNTWACTAAT